MKGALGVGAALALGMVLVAGRGGAAAGAVRVRLVYEVEPGAVGCSDEVALRRAIAERVGYDPVDPSAATAIAISVTRAGERLRAEVKRVERSGVVVGVRAIDAPERACDDLLEAVALSVGIAVDRLEQEAAASPAIVNDGGASDALPAPASAVSARAPEPVLPESRPVDHVASASPSSRMPAVTVAAGVTSSLGSAPAPAVGFNALAAARWGRFDVGLEGRMDLPASGRADLASGAVRTSFVAGGPTGCFHLEPLFGCALVFLGDLQAEAVGVAGTSEQHGFDLLAGARAGVAWGIGAGFSLRASVDLLATLYGPTVRVLGQDVWHPSTGVGSANLGVGWRIP